MKRLRSEKDNDSDDESVSRATKRTRIPYRPQRGVSGPVAGGSHDRADESSDVLERIVNEKLEGLVNRFLYNKSDCGRSDNIKGDVIIPLFDPDDRENNVFMWLKKINQLGDIYNWDDSKRAYYMQARLDGSARRWYNRLENYDYSWDEWQNLLKGTFPRMFEFSEMLEELVARKKDIKEPMSKYFYDKLAMCRRCKLDDEACVSCIIRGLPSELQASAKALKSKRPEDLYCEFLVSPENYQTYTLRSRDRDVDERKSKFPTPNPNNQKQYDKDRSYPAQTSNIIKCYRCNTEGHTVRTCTVPDPRICNICAKPGHIARFCRTVDQNKDKIKEIKIVQNLNNAYFKTVTSGQLNLTAYIDTGAQSNIITLNAVQRLQCKIQPTDKFLKGFTGTQIPAMGEVQLKITVDGLLFETFALVTHVNFGKMDLLIGQPVINRNDVTLLVEGDNVQIKYRENLPISQIEVDACSRVDIVSKSDIKLLANEAAMIQVEIRGSSGGTISSQPRYFNLSGQEYIIPATILEGSGGVIKVYNLGAKDVEFKSGQVLVRGQDCSEVLGKEENELDGRAVTPPPMSAGWADNVVQMATPKAPSWTTEATV